MRLRWKIGIIVMIMSVVSPFLLAEIDVESAEAIPIDMGSNLIQKVGGFFVVDETLVIITDEWGGNLRVLKKKEGVLKLHQIIGKRGYGPEEFLSPYNCAFDKESSMFAVADWRLKKIFLYHYYPQHNDFERDAIEISCPQGAFDLQLKGDTLFVAGHHMAKDGKRYSLYSIDLKELDGSEGDSRKSPRSLLDATEIYQLDDSYDFKTQYSMKYISAIGMAHFFDIQESGDVHMAWTGDLRVLRIDPTSQKKKNRVVFGKKTVNYVKPHPSNNLIDAYLSGDRDRYLEELGTMSLVQKLFSTSKNIYIVYEGPYKNDDKSNFWLQSYSLIDRKFKGEKQLDGKPSRNLYIDKGDGNALALYSISGDPEGGIHSLLKYRILE